VLKRIHVNQHIIRSNLRDGTTEAPITIKTYKANIRATRVQIAGPSELVYSPDEPLACGARLWIETTSTVVAYDRDGAAVDVP